MAVYFIKCESPDGFVKIGWSRSVDRRIAALQSASAYRMTLLKVVDGGHREEQALHARFAHLRHRGEWYRHDGELAVFCASQPSPDGPPPDPFFGEIIERAEGDVLEHPEAHVAALSRMQAGQRLKRMHRRWVERVATKHSASVPKPILEWFGQNHVN